LGQPGRHPKRSLAKIREVTALYIEDFRDAGDPIPTEAGKGIRRGRSLIRWRGCPLTSAGGKPAGHSNVRASHSTGRGSHMTRGREDPYARVVVPDHAQIRRGTLRRIIADAGMTVEQFLQLLGR
jgi:hypothetical protein